MIAATGHHRRALAQDQVTLVESNAVHGAEHMTGRLARPSTIDDGDQGLERKPAWTAFSNPIPRWTDEA